MSFVHQGELFIFGRIKDLIIVHGKQYAPQDIEIAVQDSHEAIRKGNVAAFSIAGPSSELLVVVAEKSDITPISKPQRQNPTARRPHPVPRQQMEVVDRWHSPRH